MSFRHGLQAQFLMLIGAALLVVLALMALLLERQQAIQAEVQVLGREAMETVAAEVVRRRGKGLVEPLAGALANPLYYYDLDEVGQLVRTALAQPDIAYVQVFDTEGLLLHDGSDGIEGYGRRLDDRFAPAAVTAGVTTIQQDASLMDVSAPILIGRERIGGVRVGYDLRNYHATRDRALGDLAGRLEALGRRQWWWMGLLGVGLMVLAAAGLWFIQRALVRPIRELARSAGEIESGNFSAHFPASGRRDELGELMRALGRMGHSVERHDREIRHLAYTDPLTGLANRLAFRELLEARLQDTRPPAGKRPLALLFADIDDFKRVNDSLGHDAGDEVLLQVAARIRQVVEQLGGERAVLARFGGDEFVVLVEPDDGSDARAVATRVATALVEALAVPLQVHDRDVFLGTSIGISLFPEDAASVTGLMKNGDIAMYQAKVAGKDCFRFYSRSMDQAVERWVHLEQELRVAWERGQLSIAYQPVFRLGDGALVGAEALLRWNHPELGLVAPSVFIDVAEQTGLISVLGPQVLQAACADAATWCSGEGTEPLFVSVNVSPRQLRGGDLPDVVSRCLAETGLSPHCLHLELTETAVIGDEANASLMLEQLRSTGVKVWLDDFGTGFSGLSHLRRVPVDGVKIDRSFVADILHDPDDLALTTAIIAMAHSLGITVVAEGVEKEGQYALLRERGCDLAQGYWLGHPLALPELLALIGQPTPPRA